MRDIFLKNELWILSIQRAFQRAGIYLKNEKSSLQDEYLRDAFRQGLREYIDLQLLNDYEVGVTEENHLANILAFKQHAESIGYGFLYDNTFKYGIAQKLLNLYLKYLWVGGYIKEPVHFPVDARIQEYLKMGKDSFPWTKMTRQNQYMTVINKAKAILAKEDLKWKGVLPGEIISIAELELYLFSKDITY
ncbi:hypothetical protein SMI01S_07740 [Sphingobacterium mizutaii NBRC 14946 = DSM 11724]|uniref:Uncharacterized protein n=2 Tax=Sphingobacterium mizutaii TaxID=1010 RepID=A0AAJ5C058_9SPHI|nr:hypothetical protein [Sphingobacterium mizutaii]GEM67168.1 hypothetical protein SMI01S_07740 [Sphingobacterium mizutaii NBRC 14946 = DSM 11724]SDK98087.1 hypothetical protein SAMN05192578_101642 [Sphingobacterium mizutaii]SNV49341.1 Uncharacterised protein [Sphingobacterium mizutaii]